METKGGSIVMHKLAFELAIRGHYVYIFNEPIYPHENIKVIKSTKFEKDNGWWYTFTWEGFVYEQNRTVSIYPNITWENPFGSDNVTRWVIGDTDEQQVSTWKQTDYICNFGTFHIPTSFYQTSLTTFDYGFKKFYNTYNPKRKGFGHIKHKNTPDWGLDFFERFESTEIPHYNGKKELDYLLEEFNKYEYVLTFDKKSYYTTAAALCGTKAIILDTNKNKSPERYRAENPIQMYGVAYGFNDLDWANKTIHLVRDYLKNLEQKDIITIENLISYWENKLK